MVNWIGLYTLVRRQIERIFRIIIQTIGAPLISAFLFIFIFGFVLGRKIDLIAGIPYMQFVFPGILTMNILSSSFEHSASTVYFSIWIRSIDEILVAPFSYLEMVAAHVASAVLRSCIVGTGIMIIGLSFGAVKVAHPLLFLLLIMSIAIVFSLVGMLVGLWAKSFEQFGILNTFIIMPLSFLGGMFYSVELLPSGLQAFTHFNPFFYFIDSMRYVTLDFHESNLFVGSLIIGGLVLCLCVLVVYLFKIGWRIRE